MKPRCPRLFEVEAARDGRLTGADLTRFQGHARHCAACAHEAGALAELAESLRSLPPVASDELHVRRQRTRLLAAFDTALVPRQSAKRWLLPLLAAAASTLLVLTLWSSRTAVPTAARTLTARDPIAIQASPTSQWSRQVESHRETITLTSGTLSVSIDHKLSPRRLRVVLPDGDLEDLGTTFSVTATTTATTHVSVQDGTVILRLRDRPALVLNANESWSPESAAPTPIPSPGPPAQPSAAVTPVPATGPAPVSAAARAPANSLTPSAPSDATTDFRAAHSALSAGNNAIAAELFAAFLVRHPAATNAEDAAYLRIIALQRAGNAEAMRTAARSFLGRYPSAFRRAEVESLSR